jgi:hypothetical protein
MMPTRKELAVFDDLVFQTILSEEKRGECAITPDLIRCRLGLKESNYWTRGDVPKVRRSFLRLEKAGKIQKIWSSRNSREAKWESNPSSLSNQS